MDKQIIKSVISYLIITGVVFGISAFVLAIYSVIAGGMLSSYMKKHNYDKWRDLSTIDTFLGKVGPGARDSFKIMEYIRGNEDDKDSYIKKLKDRIKISIRYTSIFFAASLFSLLSVLLIVFVSSH